MMHKHNKHKGDKMSTTEQERIIEALRSKAIKIKLGEVKSGGKIDEKLVWAKAQKVGKTISDDSLFTPHTAGAQ